jgi:hypothetical protein
MSALRLESVEQLCKVLHELPSRESIQVGQMITLGLEDIEKQVGPKRWSKMRELVSSFVESAIRTHSGRLDSYLKCEDGSYVIIFQGVNQDMALLKASRIAKQVNETLFGQGGFEGTTLRTIISEDEKWKSSAALKPNEVANMLAKGASKLLNSASLDEPLNIEITDEIPNPPFSQSMLDRQENRKRFAAEMADIENVPSFPLFVAMWSVPTNMIAGYQCVPARQTPFQDELSIGYDALPFDATHQDIFSFDIDILEFGLMALKDSLKEGQRSHVVFNVNFETLSAAQGRQQLTEVLRMTPPTLRQRIYVNLCDVPEGIPPSRLMELCQYLTPFFRGVTVVLRQGTGRSAIKNILSRLHASGVQIVGVELPGTVSDADLDWTKSTLSTARDLGLVSTVVNATSWREVIKLAESGVQLISGPVFMDRTDKLPAVRQFSLSDARRLENEQATLSEDGGLFSTV